MSFRRFVAIGDSQTEGVGDIPHQDGLDRGWADRFAAGLDRLAPGLLYANLAIRGRRIVPIRDEQMEAALALEPVGDGAELVLDARKPVAGLQSALVGGAGLHLEFAHLGGNLVEVPAGRGLAGLGAERTRQRDGDQSGGTDPAQPRT